MKDVPTSHTWSFGSFVCLRRFPQSLLREPRHAIASHAGDATDLNSAVAPPVACQGEVLPLSDLASSVRIDRPAA